MQITDRLRRFLEEKRLEKPFVVIPDSLTYVWVFSCLLGPAVGWLMTSNVIGSMTPANWKILVSLRLLLSCVIPVFSLLWILCFHIFPTRHFRVYLSVIFFIPITLPGYFAARNSLRDLVHGRVQATDTVILEIQRRLEWNAPWRDGFLSLSYGPYRARLKEGIILDFYCDPVCLEWPEGPYRNSNLIRENVRITYLPHLRVILTVEKR